MFISAPLHPTENTGLEVGPAVQMNEAADQVALAVPRVIWRARIWVSSLMRTLHMDAAFLQREKPFRERLWT